MPVSRPSERLPTEQPWLGVNFWSRRGGPFMWRDGDEDVLRGELAVLAQHGLNVTRSFLYWPDFHPAPDTIDDVLVDRYRRFLELSVEAGLRTIPTFVVGHMSGQNWDVTWRDGRDLYADGFVLGQQAFFIREIVRRLGDSPALAGWLISNEMPIYGGPTTREYARAWGLICSQAVRAGGSDLPVSLGDGAWTLEVTGHDNGFRLRDQADVADFFGPHSYPMGNDQVRQMTYAAFVCELAHLGKPVVLEEFGVTSAFVSEENAGHYYRQVLHHSLLAGATGWIGWNNTDYDKLADVDPHRHHLFEWGFGVTTSNGTPKAPLRELAAFRRVLDAVDFARCRRADTRTAVLLSSYVDGDHPLVDERNRQAEPRTVHHAWIAAKRAGLAPAVVRESEGVPDVELLLVPSIKALTGPTWPTLAARAEAGAHVYVSWFPGVSDNQRGAWWPDIEPLFGVRHRLRYGLNDTVDGTHNLTVTAPFGDLSVGDTLTVRVAGEPDARAHLPVDVVDADVLMADDTGAPALLRRGVGSGALYLGTWPVEYFGSVRPDANADDEVWRLYRALGVESGARAEAVLDDHRVVSDEIVHESGTRYTWLVNVTDETVDLDVPPGWSDVFDEGHSRIGPYAVRVLRRSNA